MRATPRSPTGRRQPPRNDPAPPPFGCDGRVSPCPRFLTLYGALFAAFGAASPFLPGLLQQDGLSGPGIGATLAAGTRYPAARRAARRQACRPRAGAPSLVLAGFTAAAAAVATAYAPARGLPLLMLVGVAHAAVLAPITPVADALALGSASGPRGFSYGWVRGAGSAAFIAGALLSGQLVEGAGLGVIVWLNAGLLAAAAAVAWRVPDRLAGARRAGADRLGRGAVAGAGRHPGVRPADGGRGADRRQPRAARRLRGHPLARRRPVRRAGERAVVALGGGPRSPCSWSSAVRCCGACARPAR